MATAEIFDNPDGVGQCFYCGHKPQVLAMLEHFICQHCLADAAARLAFEVGHDVCGNCRAFVHDPNKQYAYCRRHVPVHVGDGSFTFPDVTAMDRACEERLPRDRFRAGAAPAIGGEAGR